MSSANPVYSDDELLAHLRLLTRELRRAPTDIDLINWRRTHGGVGPGDDRYVSAFGSLPEARRRAGVTAILAELEAENR